MITNDIRQVTNSWERKLFGLLEKSQCNAFKCDGLIGLITIVLSKISHGQLPFVRVGLKMFLMRECDTLLPEEPKLVS